jgi:hypothetical protein
MGLVLPCRRFPAETVITVRGALSGRRAPGGVFDLPSRLSVRNARHSRATINTVVLSEGRISLPPNRTRPKFMPDGT